MPLSVPVMVGIVSASGRLVIAAFWLSPPTDTTRLWVPADNVETLIEATLLERTADATVVELFAVSTKLTWPVAILPALLKITVNVMLLP
ncbi:hypothetical protein RBB77_02715 [Tunturibacter psychrotolerans]|uniref:Secreted protein n=1 Tax=Tunturiibacter psychrotolerans TaxID=3069686 RepID=A0AAU7ZS59_9BACT